MTPAPHRMPGPLFDAVATGGGGAEALRLLARAEYSRRLACVYAITAAAREIGGATGQQAEEAWESLAAAQRAAPEATAAVIAHPSAGPALAGLLARVQQAAKTGEDVRETGRGVRETGRDLRETGRDLRERSPNTPLPTAPPMHWLTAIAAAATARAALPGSVRWTVTAPWIALPSLGRAHVPGVRAGDSAELRVTAEGQVRVGVPGSLPLTVPRDPNTVRGRWHGGRTLADDDTGAPLVLDALDPACFPGAVPQPGAIGADDLRRWRSTAHEAYRLLRTDHPVPYAELTAGPRVLVPLTRVGPGSVSGSSAETFGCVAMSLPNSGTGFAVTLTHEMQHNKFAALLHLFDLFDTAAPELYYAPWRPDPRPLLGLFHGAYAHLGVAQFWNRRRDVEPHTAQRAAAHAHFARWRTATREATTTILDSGHLTPLGYHFATHLLHTADALCALPVPAEARRRALGAARAHRSTWTDHHGTAEVLPV